MDEPLRLPIQYLTRLDAGELARLDRLAGHVARRCSILSDHIRWHVDRERLRREGTEPVEALPVDCVDLMLELPGKTLGDALQACSMMQSLDASGRVKDFLLGLGLHLASIARARL